MKILLSAYACEPNRGSEPGVGWQWALQLAKHHEVFVLTRSNNEEVIQKYFEEHGKVENLHFFYYDPPKFVVWLKHHGLPVNVFYDLWLSGLAKLAEKLHRKIHFDMAHHITFGVFRDAVYLYRLGIPVVLGPMGGGETTPKNLLNQYRWPAERLREYLRLWINHLSLCNPFLHKSFSRSTLLLCKTRETQRWLKKWQEKTKIYLEIGIHQTATPEEILERKKDEFLYVGRFIPLKGIKIILQTFRNYCQIYPEAHFTLIGKGEMEKDIRAFISENNLEKNVTIHDWMAQTELISFYRSATAMIFPSMHDSSGNVVLEAMAQGCPVVCLDCGGPVTILGDSLQELIVPTPERTVGEICQNMTQVMNRLHEEPEWYRRMSNASLRRAQDFLWPNVVEQCYKDIESRLKNQ